MDLHTASNRLSGRPGTVGTWIRRKHGRISWRQVRYRYCDGGWRYAHNRVAFRGAASVTVTRYRYRGTRIATPWTINPTTAPG